MVNKRQKSKKNSPKKNSDHMIPTAKVAKGRRPHTEMTEEVTQPSLFDVDDTNEFHSQDEDTLTAKDLKQSNDIHNHAESEEFVKTEEVILEGQPAPKQREKVDLKQQIENVKGMVQMGTALVKSSFPKPFEIAEKVVENWKEDGDFSELPIEQPLLQFYLGLGLRKAKKTEKEIEQKLEVAGVLPVFRQQWQKAQKYFK